MRPARTAPAWLPLAALLILLPAVRPAAEVRQSVKITALGGLATGPGGDSALLLGLARASLDLESAGNRNVQGFLQIDSFIGDSVSFEVPRAYIRARLPGFRTMIGRNRVSWGDGFYFNAGDVIFGSMDPTARNFTADAIRDETDWLLEVYVPLGQFSFLEGVVLPFGGGIAGDGGGEGSEGDEGAEGSAGGLAGLFGAASFEEAAAGLRAVTRLGGVKVEGGYLFNGGTSAHRPYLNLQGHLGVDWFLSASLDLRAGDPDWDEVADGLDISAGLYTILDVPFAESLSLRLEAGLQPYAEWRESATAPAEGGPGYGLYLFPEAVLAVSPTASLQFRSLLSPVDGSAFFQAGASWNIYQGLTLLGYAAAMAGDSDDLFGWGGEHAGSLSLTLGMEYIY